MNTVEPIRDIQKIDKMKKILKEDNLRDWLLFVLGINSGLRISDLLKLRVSDVKGQSRVKIREQKTGKEKDFPLSDSCQKAIKEYLAAEKLEPGEFLFGSQKGGSITRRRAYQVLIAAAKKARIKEAIGTHTMRKTFGYHAYKTGVDLSIIQKLLNHADQSVTLRYIGITRDQLDDVYINLNL